MWYSIILERSCLFSVKKKNLSNYNQQSENKFFHVPLLFSLSLSLSLWLERCVSSNLLKAGSTNNKFVLSPSRSQSLSPHPSMHIHHLTASISKYWTLSLAIASFRKETPFSHSGQSRNIVWTSVNIVQLNKWWQAWHVLLLIPASLAIEVGHKRREGARLGKPMCVCTSFVGRQSASSEFLDSAGKRKHF